MENSAFMKTIILLLLTNFLFSQCSEEDIKSVCSTRATVRDLTGLDGCGFVFELEDGTRIDPIVTYMCGTPPLPKKVTEDPLFNFIFAEGKKVLISFEPASDASICMAGLPAKITCLSEISEQNTEVPPGNY